jgi:hypothetical protein
MRFLKPRYPPCVPKGTPSCEPFVKRQVCVILRRRDKQKRSETHEICLFEKDAFWEMKMPPTAPKLTDCTFHTNGNECALVAHGLSVK